MSKKIVSVVALAGMCALSLFFVSCGSSSSRPSGALYVLTEGSSGQGNNISSFAMDLNTGNLALINSNASTCPTAATGTNTNPCGLPLNIILDPAGSAALVLDQGAPPCPTCDPMSNVDVAPAIYSYTENSDGSLSAPGAAVNWTCISQSATPCSSTNAYPDTAVAMVRDATGQFLFVIDHGEYPLPTTCPAIATAVTNSSQSFAGCPSISVFAMQPSLTFVSQSSTYQSPFFLSKTPSALSVVNFTAPGSSTAQELLLVTSNYDLCTIGCVPMSTPHDSTVSVYSVGSSGVLTEQLNSPYAIAAVNPISVQAVNTNPVGQTTGGPFVYVGSQDQNGGNIYPFQMCWVLNASCSQLDVDSNLLVPLATCPQVSCNIPPTAAGSKPVAMLLDPTNNFLYVLSELSNQVFGFKINTTAGSLTVVNSKPTGSEPVSMVLHPTVNNTGQFLYTSNSNSANISGFTLSTTSGVLSDSITIVSPAAPSGMAVH